MKKFRGLIVISLLIWTVECFFGQVGFAIEPIRESSPQSHDVNSDRSLFSNSKSGGKILSVDKFVEQNFRGAIPIKRMRAFAQNPEEAKDVESKLTPIINKNCSAREGDSVICSNALNTLGVIGAEHGYHRILQVLSFENPFNFNLKTNAIIALGYWLNTNGHGGKGILTSGTLNEESLSGSNNTTDLQKNIYDELVQLLENTNNYDNRAIQKLPFQIKLSEKKEKLRKKQIRSLRRGAIFALAVSGKNREVEIGGTKHRDLDLSREPQDVLENLLKEAPAGSSYRAMVIEALKAHNTIAKIGLECYYEGEKNKLISRECKAKWAKK